MIWDAADAIEAMRKECKGAVTAVSKEIGYVISPDGKKIEVQLILQADENEWLG